MGPSGIRLAIKFPARPAIRWARPLRCVFGMVIVFAIAGSLSLGALAAQKQQKQPKSKKNDKQDESVELRHYAIKATPVGISKSVKKLVQSSQLPDLGKLEV